MVDMKEIIYRKSELLNFNALNQQKQKIIDNNIIIPRYIAQFIMFDIMDSNEELWEKMINQSEKPMLTYIEAMDEFIEWVKKHDEYSDLLNKENYKKFLQELEILNKELPYSPKT